MAFTELYVQPTGSNLNAGSTNSNTALATYTSKVVANGWNQATGVFTVSTGDPVADGVAVGDFASVYVTAGATVATFVGRITARDTTTITVSLTAVSGTPPATDALGATTMKVGGAWAGPATTVAFPFGFVQLGLQNAAGDTPRVNFKNGTTYSITAAMTHAHNGPIRFQGYTSTVGDGGKATVDGGTSGASYVLLTVSGANTDLTDLIFQNNGATGNANGVSVTGAKSLVRGCVVNSVRGHGFSSASGSSIFYSECEAYSCNQNNSSALGGFNCNAGSCEYFRCISHDHSGNLAVGFRISNAAHLSNCIADTNGGDGYYLDSVLSVALLNCDAYGNGGAGIELLNTSAALYYIENCNLVKNGGWGINGSGAGARNGRVINCGFGSGTQVNTSGSTTGLKSMTEAGSITYPSNATPWVAPATGDFRISLRAAQGTGRGTFTQTQASYSGTVGYPDVGAAQHLNRPLGIPTIGRGPVN